MPRVSDAYLAQRRQQILDAARRCFLTNGFHATTMQDVIGEAGLSVGAVYRYFKSKNEIVIAIAEEVISGLDGMLSGLISADLPLLDVLDRSLSYIDGQTGEDGAFRLAVQVWAEALRDPSLAALVTAVYGRIRDNFVEIARRAQKRGELPTTAGVEELGAVLFGIMPSYALQKVLTGTPELHAYRSAVVALMNAHAGPSRTPRPA